MKIFLTKIYFLLMIQILAIRLTGFWLLLHSILTPLGIMSAIALTGYLKNTEWIHYIISGNLIISILNVGLLMTAQTIGNQKYYKGFHYYFSLPITPLQYSLSIIIYNIIMGIPSIFILIFSGLILFKVNFNINFLGLLFLLLLCILIFGFLGIFIGLKAKNISRSGGIAQLLILFFMFLTPMLYPITRLPIWWQMIIKFTPIPYVSNSLQAMLFLEKTESLSKNVMVLFIFLFIFVFITLNSKAWKEE